jgi:hypothetical protein
MEIFSPDSVVDIGCGLGSWLSVFAKHGAGDILGVDGDWVDKEMLNIPQEQFHKADLTRPLRLDKRYDLALSLEVAEHLPESAADTFVQSLVDASDHIIFSAAVPFQGGQNHINEQQPSYWITKFASHHYHCYDALRPIIWNDGEIAYWYRQNILIFSKKELPLPLCGDMVHLVHPQSLANKAKEIEHLITGQSGLRLGWRMFWRSLLFFIKRRFNG